MYKIRIDHENDYAFKVTAGESVFSIDAKSSGLTPLDALLSGLGSCIGVYIRKYAEGARLDIGKFSVSVEAELPNQSPFCFKLIKVNVDLKDAMLDDRRKSALLEFIKNCPAHRTFENKPEIQIKLI